LNTQSLVPKNNPTPESDTSSDSEDIGHKDDDKFGHLGHND